MFFFRFILFLGSVAVLLKWSDGVQINMQGSLSLGKDVVDTLSHFVQGTELSGRRSFGETENSDSDIIALTVNSAFLCYDLVFCKGETGKLVNKYIIALAKAVESEFEVLVNDIDKKQNENSVKGIIFEGELKRLLIEIKNLLRNIDEKIDDTNKAYLWIGLLKRLNARFQVQAVIFASRRLEGQVQEISEVKKILTQKLIIATILLELEFETTLCVEHNICSKTHECSKALNTLLETMKTLPDDKAKEFFRSFYETLPGTSFYYRISDVTAQEFQSILYDMAYGENIITMDVLSTIQKNVEDRLNVDASKFNTLDYAYGRDIKLVHVILSDMDHFYNKPKKEPFQDFLSDFYVWAKEGGRLRPQLRRVMKDIQNALTFESDELVLKLVNEVRVFMEITVDPIKS